MSAGAAREKAEEPDPRTNSRPAPDALGERKPGLRVVAADKPAPPPYVLPLAGKVYDRSPTLRPSEIMALRAYAARETSRAGRARVAWGPELDRLAQPLLDVAALHACSGPLAERGFARRTVQWMFAALHDRATDHGDDRTFWAWDRAEWIAMCDARATLRPLPKSYAEKPFSPALAAAAAAYLCSGIYIGGGKGEGTARVDLAKFSRMIFGEHLADLYARVIAQLRSTGYHAGDASRSQYLNGLILIALFARSPHPEHWRPEHATAALNFPHLSLAGRAKLPNVSKALRALGYDVPQLPRRARNDPPNRFEQCPARVPEAWWQLVNRWLETSTLRRTTRDGIHTALLKMARWLGAHHPTVLEPARVTRPIIAEYVASVIHDWRVGDQYAGDLRVEREVPRRGEPLHPAGIVGQLASTRTFFRDVEEWEWARLKFKLSALRAPRHVRESVAEDARDIDAPFFAKLIWASLNLTDEDLGHRKLRERYPLAYMRAVAILWTHGALRANEIRRLSLGCARFALDWDAVPDGPFEQGELDAVPASAADGAAGYLLVPENKTSRAFVKAISSAVVRALHAWERERPPGQAAVIDKTSRRLVHPVFMNRGMMLAREFINRTLIPLLCAKMGIPVHDARGKITSHRARHTISTLLLNAPEGMSHEELASWLGHRDTRHTRRYARVTPAKQAEKLARASKNLVQVDVVLDLDAIAAGDVTHALLYDLGHGWCANKFFALCAHRMACARCKHYKPKPESGPALLQLRRNHVRLKQEIELRPEELAAMDGDDAAVQKLVDGLRDTPTPDGRTPHELDIQRAASGTAE